MRFDEEPKIRKTPEDDTKTEQELERDFADTELNGEGEEIDTHTSETRKGETKRKVLGILSNLQIAFANADARNKTHKGIWPPLTGIKAYTLDLVPDLLDSFRGIPPTIVQRPHGHGHGEHHGHGGHGGHASGHGHHEAHGHETPMHRKNDEAILDEYREFRINQFNLSPEQLLNAYKVHVVALSNFGVSEQDWRSYESMSVNTFYNDYSLSESENLRMYVGKLNQVAKLYSLNNEETVQQYIVRSIQKIAQEARLEEIFQ